MPELFTLADLERRFKFRPSQNQTVTRNRFKALRPGLERQGLALRIQPGNKWAVTHDALKWFARLKELMDSGLTERQAADKVLEENGDRAPEPAELRRLSGEFVSALVKLAEDVAELGQRVETLEKKRR